MKVDPIPRLALPTDAHFRRTLEAHFRLMAQAINDAEVRAGPTTDRPVGADLRPGRQYFDTTLNQPIWYDGTGWVNSAGTDADA